MESPSRQVALISILRNKPALAGGDGKEHVTSSETYGYKSASSKLLILRSMHIFSWRQRLRRCRLKTPEALYRGAVDCACATCHFFRSTKPIEVRGIPPIPQKARNGWGTAFQNFWAGSIIR